MVAPIVAAGIAAGASLLGTGGQIYAAGKMNKKTRQWNEKMYGIQRADALKDWDMTNAYNSPEQQMQRFKEAGLNPNLIYGQSNEGATVRSTDAKSWNPETPDIQGGVRNAIGAYQDFTLQDEQVKNMQAQRENMALDGVIKALTAKQIEASIGMSTFDLGQKQALAETAIQQAQENLNQTKYGNTIMLDRNEREAALNTSSLKEAAERILTMRLGRAKTEAEISSIHATTNNLKKSGVLQDLDIELRRQGINPNDPMWMRILGRLLGDTDIIGEGKKLIKDIPKNLNPIKIQEPKQGWHNYLMESQKNR